ncbi:MAG: hypothetical protein AAF961_10280 [Planctomycetota bacterium]
MKHAAFMAVFSYRAPTQRVSAVEGVIAANSARTSIPSHHVKNDNSVGQSRGPAGKAATDDKALLRLS